MDEIVGHPGAQSPARHQDRLLQRNCDINGAGHVTDYRFREENQTWKIRPANDSHARIFAEVSLNAVQVRTRMDLDDQQSLRLMTDSGNLLEVFDPRLFGPPLETRLNEAIFEVNRKRYVHRQPVLP